jgi:photosystem II stability/assembly factor-like uncharacterized protein
VSRRPAAVLVLALALACVDAGPGLAQAPSAPKLTFTRQETATTSVLFGVAFTDADHGHAVGGNHLILGTADGGRTWVPETTPLPTRDPVATQQQLEVDPRDQAFTAVSFTDTDHGHAVASDDAVLATSDGGRTWALQPTPRPSTVGATWPQGIPPPGWGFNAVSFADADRGFAVGADGVILATTDGGGTWKFQGDPRFGVLGGVSFADQLHGEAVGHITGRPNQVYYTTLETEDGETWAATVAGTKDDSVAPVNLTAVATAVPFHAVAVGDGGRIFVTFDGGKTWRNRRNGTNETLTAVSFFDRRRGLAVGTVNFQGDLRAQVLATVDGGDTWTAYPSPEYADFEGVDFADAGTAYAVGCAKRIAPVKGPTCAASAVVKIDFPELSQDVEQPAPSGGSMVPVVLLGAALAVVAAGLLIARRR